MLEQFDHLIGQIELGAAASTVRPDNQGALMGIDAQKQLAKLICEYKGLLIDLKRCILENKPVVEQEALINVFSHIEPSKAYPEIFLLLFQICVESEGLRTSKIAQSLTWFANHPSGRNLAYPLIMNLLKGNMQYTVPPYPPMKYSYRVEYATSDAVRESIQHGALIGLWNLLNPSNELVEIVKGLANREKLSSRKQGIVRGRAIELLGKWRLGTPEVIDIIKRAQHDGLDSSNTLLLKYSETALKELGYREP